MMRILPALFLLTLSIVLCLPLSEARSTITLGKHEDTRGRHIKGFPGRVRGRERRYERRQEGQVEGGGGEVVMVNSTTLLELVVSTSNSATPTSTSSSISLTAPSFEQLVVTPVNESPTTSSSTTSSTSESSTTTSSSASLIPYVYTGPTWSAVYTISSSSTSSNPPEPTPTPVESVTSDSATSLSPDSATSSTIKGEQSTTAIVVPMETTIVPDGQSGSVGVSTLSFSPTSTSTTEMTNPGTATTTPTQISSVLGTVAGTTTTTPAPAPSGNTTTPTSTRTTHTIVINPTEGIKKLIPFVLTAQPGDRLGFIVYGANSDPSSTSDSPGSGLGIERVGPGCKPLDGVDVKGEEVDGVFELEVKGDEEGKMVFGSTNMEDCLGGMVLLVNVQDGNTSNANDDKQDQEILSFGQTKVNGSTIRQAVTTWGTQNIENLEALRSFQSSGQMTPQAWGWGDELSLSGLEGLGLGLDGVVQNVLYTRLTLALNPSLLEEYTTNTSAPTGSSISPNSTNPSGTISIITELTAHPTFLPSSGGMESTTEVYGGNAQGTVSAGYGRPGENGCTEAARSSKALLGVVVGLAGLAGFFI